MLTARPAVLALAVLCALPARADAEPLQVTREKFFELAEQLGFKGLVDAADFIKGITEPIPDTIDLSAIPRDVPDDVAFIDVVAVGARGGFHCTGIAVAPEIVLTAAHCLPATEVVLALRVARVFHRVEVVEARRHPTLDAALLRLASTLPLTVRARRRAGERSEPRGLIRTVGFGIDDPLHGGGFGVKRRGDGSVNGWGCDRGRAATTGCLPGAEMVVTPVGGRDTCVGDSGGPLLELDGDSWRLTAITVRPTRRAGAACGRGGIYLRVDVLDPWITTFVEEDR